MRAPFVLPKICCAAKLKRLFSHRLLQRYQNVKNELESQQNIERLRAEKYLMKTLFPQTSTMR